MKEFWGLERVYAESPELPATKLPFGILIVDNLEPKWFTVATKRIIYQVIFMLMDNKPVDLPAPIWKDEQANKLWPHLTKYRLFGTQVENDYHFDGPDVVGIYYNDIEESPGESFNCVSILFQCEFEYLGGEYL